MKKEEMMDIKKQKSLKYSIKDGMASSVHANIEATFIPQLALALKGTSFHVGIISALSGLLAPLAQLIGDKLMEKESRKKIINKFILIQILLIFVVSAISYAFINEIYPEKMIYALIITYTLITICAGVIYPAWFSWIGDLVPKDTKGKFFSKRNIVVTIAGLIIIPLGIALDKIEALGYLMIGFSIIFLISAIFKTLSLKYINKQYEPKFKLKDGYYFSIVSFIKRFDDVGKFAVYYALFNLALMIASPFFAVYMKQELNFDYLEITIISLMSSIFYIIFSPLIGKISDKYGNVKLLYISTILFSINPLLWTFLKSVWSLSILPQLVTGIANAAMGIATTNFIFNMTKQEHRALCISYLSILAGVGTFLGAILGGLIIKFVPLITAINPFIAIFIISGIARLLISVGLIKKLKETEDGVKPLKIPKIHFLHPLKTIHSELHLIKKIAH